MAYIKSTNEHIFNTTDVLDSVENHLGIEYRDEVQRVLYNDRSEFVPAKAHEKEVKEWEDAYNEQERHIDGLSCTITSTYNYINDIISHIRTEKRLNREKLIKMLKEIETDLGNFT